MRLDLKPWGPSEQKAFCVEAKYGQLGGKDCAHQVETSTSSGFKKHADQRWASLIKHISKSQNPKEKFPRDQHRMILRHHWPLYITQILHRMRKGKHFLQEPCQTWRMDSFIDSIIYPFLDIHDFLPQTIYSEQMRTPLQFSYLVLISHPVRRKLPWVYPYLSSNFSDCRV